ncbi:MAG TPA: hypothetical protein VI933_01695 [archaeon]|nr:hypothetical protein [archaeon]
MQRRITEGEERILKDYLNRNAVQLYAQRNPSEKYSERALCHPTQMTHFGGRGAKVIVIPVNDLTCYEFVDIYPGNANTFPDGAFHENVVSLHNARVDGLGLPEAPQSWEPMLVYVDLSTFFDDKGRYKSDPGDDPTLLRPDGIGTRPNIVVASRNKPPPPPDRQLLPPIPAR